MLRVSSGRINTKPSVMISYSHRDLTHMQAIKQGLTKAGFDVLVDEDQFSLSYSTTPEMNRLVDTADLLLVLLSPDSVASKPVQHEVARGLRREIVEQRKVVFAAKVRPCARLIRGWPEDRLYINLCSNSKTLFERLVRNLRRAAKAVVPLAETLPTAADLADFAETLLERSGMRMLGRVGFFSRFGPTVNDDPARRIIALPISNAQFAGPAFFCTYRGWTLFWHFPKSPLVFRAYYDLTEVLFAKCLVAARIGGYLANHKISDPQMEELARMARRHPRVMDVVVSPYPIPQTHYARHNLALLKWPREQPFLVYHRTHAYSPWHSLPTFFAPKTQTVGDLHTVFRFLKAVIRVEVPRLQVPAERWMFMDDTLRKLRKRKKT